MDLILQRTGGVAAARPRAWSSASAFLATFIAVQWPFADFLMTPAARNWFFGTGYIDFATPRAIAAGALRILLPRADAGDVLARHGDRAC